jgi:sirohydrochlorin cobaltochelatase
MRHDAYGRETPVFTQDALLLIGHGSSVLSDAARPLRIHADIIRATARFAEVSVGTLVGEPNAAAAFATLTAPVIHVVPFFLEDGYITRFAIPDLILPLASAKQVIRFCAPIGSHDGIADVLEAHLLRHCELFGTHPKSLSVLLVGHGSSRAPGRARALRRHASTLESRGRFGWVRVSLLEEAPFVADALASARGHVVAVVGYFANEGVHAMCDLPALIASNAARIGHRCIFWEQSPRMKQCLV